MNAWANRQLRNLAGVFFRPRATMQRVGQEPEFWIPIVLVSMAIAGLRLTTLPEVRAQFADPKTVQEYQQKRSISESEARAQLDRIAQLTPALMVAEAPLMVLAGAAAVSFLLQLIGRIGYKQSVPFRRLLSIVAWGSVISVIPLALNIALQILNRDYTLPSSPALFLPAQSEGTYLYNVLLSLDVFLIWQVYTLSLGFAALFAISLQRALTSVGTLLVVFIAINALIMSAAH